MKPTTARTNWIRRLTVLAATMVVWWSPPALAGTPDGCEPGWAEGVFPVNPVDIGLNGSVLAIAEFDSGDGPQLIVGGEFTRPANSDEPLLRLARWTGDAWESIGQIQGSSSWTRINAMAVFDDGTGPKLYVGGRFNAIDGQEIRNIACWDGEAWSGLDNGLSNGNFATEVHAMAVYRNFSGDEVLVVGGNFSSVAGLPQTQNIASWTGTAWSRLGGSFGAGGLNGPVHSLHVHTQDQQQILYAGGSFTVYTTGFSNNIARWNGITWTGMGEGLGEWPESTVHSIEIFDDGSGPTVYAGGDFESEGGAPRSGILRWDGTQWADLGSGVNGDEPVVYGLQSAVIEGEPKLLVGGSFDSVSSVDAPGLALWGESGWSLLPSDVDFDTNDVVRTFYVPADDSISDLVVGGGFGSPDLRSSNVARWNEGVWSRPANIGLNGVVRQFVSPQDPSDPSLTVFGDFTVAGEAVEADGSGLWSDAAWSDAGYGYIDSSIRALWFDDGSGEALHAVIPDWSGVAADVHKWTGSEWQPLGIPQFLGGEFPFAQISDLEVYSDPDGDALFVVGWFESPDFPFFYENVLKWDGEIWSAPFVTDDPFGVTGFDTVQAGSLGAESVLFFSGEGSGLVIWDGVTQTPVPWEVNGKKVITIAPRIRVVGNRVYAHFATASSAALHAWDGQEWSELPFTPNSGEPPSFTWLPQHLFSVQEPDGEYFYVVEQFTQGSSSRHRLLRYDGTNWSVVASEVNGPIYAVAAHDDGTGPALYIGGDFSEVDGVPSGFMAKRPFCDEQPCPADVTGDGVIDLADLNAVLGAFGQASDSGDANGDGSVDMNDLNIVLGAFGAVCK